jgi:hypothetical protein
LKKEKGEQKKNQEKEKKKNKNVIEELIRLQPSGSEAIHCGLL